MSLNGLNYKIEPVPFALLSYDLPAENDNVLTQRKNKKKRKLCITGGAPAKRKRNKKAH
jgi:hypothetical protein